MKYMGSKSRIAKHIVPIIQNEIDNFKGEFVGYVEPFVGGANVIDKIKCDWKVGSDANKFLISLLLYVRDGGELPQSISKEEYSRVRDEYNKIIKGEESDMAPWYIGCVGFLASYNGRFFDGGYARSGFEKTPRGERFRDYYRESSDNLLEQAKDLGDCVFVSSDYKNLNPHGHVIYCDPPYEGTKQYHGEKFDHVEFWNAVRKWSKDNIVLVSEESAPNDFEIVWEQEVSRSIKSTDKSKSIERLYKYKAPKKEEKCWIHVDWFFTDNYDYDYWLVDRSGGCNSSYYIEATRFQFDTIRSFKPHKTNSRTTNEALIETLKNLFDKYELVERVWKD